MSSREGQCTGREEQIAAMVEGRLTPDQRAQLIEHLPDCEICYEIFTELVRMAEEDEDDEEAHEPRKADVVRHPRSFVRPRVSWARLGWAVAAAVLATVSILALRHLLGSDPASSQELTASFERQGSLTARLADDWTEPLWDSVPRLLSVGNLTDDQASVRLGARVVDLYLALRADQPAAPLAAELALIAEESELPEPARLYTAIRDRFLDDEPASSLLSLAQEAEAELGSAVARRLDPRLYRLGKLAEAGRLASGVEDASFFERRDNRRLFSTLAEDMGPEAPPELKEAAELIGSRPDGYPFQALENLFREVLRRYGSRPL